MYTEQTAIIRCKRHETARTVRVFVSKSGNVFSAIPQSAAEAWDLLFEGFQPAACGCRRSVELVKGTKGARKCDDRCREAINFKCSCDCGGENHGANYSDAARLALAQRA